MRDCNQGWFRQQFNFLRRQFLQDGSLPFSVSVQRSQVVVWASVKLSGVF